VQVANGTTDKASPTCKKLVEAGAVRIKWEADAAYGEEESFTWSILTVDNWNSEAVLGWRYTAAALQERLERPPPPDKRPRAR
jgi:hypothetical protein